MGAPTDLRTEVSAEIARGVAKRVAEYHESTEKVLVGEVTFDVTIHHCPAVRDSYGYSPAESELVSVTLFGVELLHAMSKDQQEEMMKAAAGDEATL